MSTFEHRSTRKNLRTFIDLPLRVIKHHADQPAEWKFPDGSCSTGGCIGCADEPCRLVTPGERSVAGIDAFATESGSALCPVKAISWDASSESPVIDATQCIGCGLCVARCPVGAISLVDRIATVSKVEDEAREPRTTLQSFDMTKDNQRSQIQDLPRVESSHPVANDAEAARITTALSKQTDTVQKNAVRSIIVAGGGSVALTRKGDVHTRMDGTYSTGDGAKGSIEIEFGMDSLEAVRASLDDVAVLSSRYGLSKENQSPLVVCAQLPRERQGYWQVVRDINRVLDLEVRTATVGSLLLLVWNGHELTAWTLDQLTPHFESTSIRKQIETVLGRPVALPLGEGGILEPEK